MQRDTEQDELMLDVGYSTVSASKVVDGCSIDQVDIGVLDNEKLSWSNSVGIL